MSCAVAEIVGVGSRSQQSCVWQPKADSAARCSMPGYGTGENALHVATADCSTPSTATRPRYVGLRRHSWLIEAAFLAYASVVIPQYVHREVTISFVSELCHIPHETPRKHRGLRGRASGGVTRPGWLERDL